MRAVFFDLDDTLVDQESAAVTAVVAWAAEHGIECADVVPRWAEVSANCYSRYQRRELTFLEQRRERARSFLGVDADDTRADELFAGYLRRYEANWTVFDDAVPALRRAKASGLIVAVLTNGDEAHQRFKLEKLGLTNEVDVFVASSVLPAGKPDPRAFAHALDVVGVAHDDALMVGNSLRTDVLGALGAGVDAVLLDRHDRHPDADVRRIRSLAELDFDAN
ncbi:HAD family hydrolase [Microlunatus sp. Y2014]|uniref:HAD family hydrolase n=1 Tax=Microlunatus sp. Y2014 TaxID=3418488 RepID=UPI003DA73C36